MKFWQLAVLATIQASVVAVAVVVAVWLLKPGHDSPDSGYDKAFASLGREYLPELGKAYGKAWEAGAAKIDAGLPIAAASEEVTKAWQAQRVDVFNRMITPQLQSIFPEGADEASITPSQRVRMARAYRGLGRGCSGQ
jgi:hypothetical protein